MPVGLGPRFLIEAGFIVAVAVVAGVERFSTTTIVLLMLAAWLLVAAVEVAIWLRTRSHRARPDAARVAHADAPPTVPDPDPEPEVAAPPAPERLDEPPVEATPAVEAVPEPEPEPVAPPVLVAAEPTPHEPEPLVEHDPEPRPEVVQLDSRRPTAPREWNLWDLERLARDEAGTDEVRDEERSYLLMYLREFANADGVLPTDFDSVVRETFGDSLDAAYL